MIILQLKELVILVFFSSKTGTTEGLQFKGVPETFKGCGPLKEIDKTWAI